MGTGVRGHHLKFHFPKVFSFKFLQDFILASTTWALERQAQVAASFFRAKWAKILCPSFSGIKERRWEAGNQFAFHCGMGGGCSGLGRVCGPVPGPP